MIEITWKPILTQIRTGIREARLHESYEKEAVSNVMATHESYHNKECPHMDSLKHSTKTLESPSSRNNRQRHSSTSTITQSSSKIQHPITSLRKTQIMIQPSNQLQLTQQ